MSPRGFQNRLGALSCVALVVAGLGALLGGSPNVARAQAPTAAQKRSIRTWVLTGASVPAGRIDVAVDPDSRNAAVVWAAPDGVRMRRLSLDKATLEPARLLMQGRGYASPSLHILPAADRASGDLLVVAQRGARMVAQGFQADGTPLGGVVFLSGRLPGVHGHVVTAATTDGVAVAWTRRHAGERVLFSRVDRTGSALIAPHEVRTPAFPPLLVGRPPAGGPGFLLDTLDTRGRWLRAFDLEGEQVALSRHREPYLIALLPHDESTVLELTRVRSGARGERVAARLLDGDGAPRAHLGTIGPELHVGTRLVDRPLEAAAHEERGVAIVYARGRGPGDWSELDVFLFDAELRPRRGRWHHLDEGWIGDASAPAWTDEGEVLVAWYDASRGRLVLGLVPLEA